MIFKNESGQSKGSGIIEFSSNQDADYVVKQLSGTQLGARNVTFAFDSKAPYSGGAGSRY